MSIMVTIIKISVVIGYLNLMVLYIVLSNTLIQDSLIAILGSIY